MYPCTIPSHIFSYSFYQTYSNVTREQASTPAFVGALTKTFDIVLELKSNKSVTLKDFTAKNLRRRLLAAQTDYLADIVSGLQPEALITKLDNSVASGNFSAVLSKASGLAVGVITMKIQNISPTSMPTQVPVQQAVVDLSDAKETKGITLTLPPHWFE